ncbi:hypothetical protein CHS0354_033204 [Potamilus streckersoni]|uniref:Uncharacterized protein n=1 Tax=Potamilus streckersoni TaxID=2493646 RepID=A0AAE0VQC0_9BIVA|nr:hypothetical protein CHS0354_033204 [Potamilus streckersoni]
MDEKTPSIIQEFREIYLSASSLPTSMCHLEKLLESRTLGNWQKDLLNLFTEEDLLTEESSRNIFSSGQKSSDR